MAVGPGTRIGSYEVSALVGAGGMGEVFRAVDLNLGRAAAIKVLPASLAGDPERLARFEREAQTLASLNHPHIAQVFGFEKGEGNFRAMAMEFVDGPTLAERIAGGPLPVDEAVAIAVQVADALESAHDHAIIHRDLKPQNIKVRDDGVVKVLDFGLAKAMGVPADSTPGMADSPTITTPAMTAAGVVLGTAAYMSPEQAKGRVVDRRADVWAFGCVLFEMLSGTRAFSGADVSDVFVSILRDEPDWSALPRNTPPHVRSLLRRCLQKDLRKRLPHIGVARLELADPAAAVADATPARTGLVWRAAAVAGLLLAIGIPSWLLWSRPSPAPAPSLRLSVDLGTAEPVLLTAAGGTALAPDGRVLAFVGRPPQSVLRTNLYLRFLDRLEAQRLAGTEAAQMPFFSHDGRWVAFFAEGMLKKVATNGGPVVSICPAPSPRGGWWGEDDVIVFAAAAGLSRVPAGGGTPAPVPTTATSNIPAFPQHLPRGRGILYSFSPNTDPSVGSVFVQDLAGGPPKEILQGGRFPRYVASGHLTFVRRGTLFAVPFDLDRLAAVGEPVPIVERVYQAPVTATPDVAVSANGTLAYQSGTAADLQRTPVMWLAQAEGLTPLRETPATFGSPRFSPDGRRLAMAIADGGLPDIWVYDWERDILTRITSDPAADVGPVWTPDGTGLVFGSARDADILNLYWQRADGTGTAERLTTSQVPQIPNGFDPAGRTLVFHEGNPATNRQAIGMLPVERDTSLRLKVGTPAVLVGGPFLKSNARISPDGKWIAYAAYDTGNFEIYVQPFPALGHRVQVSSGGGSLAVWSTTKSELYYAMPGGQRMMAVPYAITDGMFVPEKPRPWSATRFSPTPPIATYGPGFDLHPDGRRFAVTPLSQPGSDAAGPGQIMLLLNLFDELRRLAPTR